MRPTRRLCLSLAALVTFAGVAFVKQTGGTAGIKMADAAQKFLGSLTAEQRAKAAFAFDSPERLKWAFVPLQDAARNPTRKGVRLEELTATQREAALALLQAGTSPAGYAAATTIMSLEAILREQERQGPVRNPGWYFLTVFGTPGKTGKWSWRIEGHHLSLNFLIENGQVVSATPSFFGANPATVMAGPKQGLKAIGDVEDLARELYLSLDDGQKKLALQEKQFPEIVANSAAAPGTPVGIPAAKLSGGQRATLTKLLQAYTGKLPEDVAAAEMGRITAAGVEKVHFAYAGATEPGKPHTYRLQGPSFVAEFLNIQRDGAGNPANHIHSAWRHLPKDFGLASD